MEEDEALAYLALERCSQNLADLMQAQPELFCDQGAPTEFAVKVSSHTVGSIDFETHNLLAHA